MSTTSARRVPEHTSDAVNAQISDSTQQSVVQAAAHPTEIGKRLRELDMEWDVERTLEANAAILGLVGMTLAATVDRRFLALPMAVSAFLLQHAVQGWCPPLPVLRRMGFRTATEIAEERTALRALRGDFAGLEHGAPVAALDVARGRS